MSDIVFRESQSADSVAGDDLFDDPPVNRLGSLATRGSAIVVTAMIAQKTVGFAVVAVLSRLLTPHDYGLFGMVLVLLNILGLFTDLGLGDATVQKTNLSKRQFSNAFWLNVGVSMALGLSCAVAAPAIAWFYKEPFLIPLAVLCAATIPLTGLGTQHGALLIRRLAFGHLCTCELTGALVGAVAGVLTALRGAGVYALVAQQLVTAGVATGMKWVFAWCVPGLPSRRSGFRGMVGFGGYITAFNFVNYFVRNLDNILLGRFGGPSVLGLYARAYTLMMYPVSFISAPLGRVALPALSKLQGDWTAMRAAYVRMLAVIGFTSFPLMVGLFLCADDAIRVAFGGRWVDAVPIFRWLCVAGVFQGIYNGSGQIFTASGRADRMLRSGLTLAFMMVIAFVVAANKGPVAMAAAYAITMSIALVPYLMYTYRTIDLRFGNVARAVAPAFWASLGMVPFVWGVGHLVPTGLNCFLRLLAEGIVGGVAYSSILLVLWRAELMGVLRPIAGRFFPESVRLCGRAPAVEMAGTVSS